MADEQSGNDVAGDATLLAELGRLDDDGTVAAEPTDAPEDVAAQEAGTETEATEDEDAEEATDEEAEDTEDEASEDAEETETETATEDEETEEEKPDTEAEKRIARIHAAEKRAKKAVADERAQLAEERSKFVADKTSWSERVERFEKLAERAAYDPGGVLSLLGLGEDDYEPAARQLYAMSPEGRKNPKLREEAAQQQRVRGTSSELDELRTKVAGMEKAQQEREHTEAQARDRTAYLEQAAKAITDDAPIMSAMLRNDREGAHEMLWSVAAEVYRDIDGVPTPAQVIERAEANERKAAKKRGFDPPRVGKKTGTKNTPLKVKKNTEADPVTANTNKTSPDNDRPRTREEIDKEILSADIWPA